MSSTQVCVKSAEGLHSRTAVQFSQSANTFKSYINIESQDGKTAPGKSLLGLLRLGINYGQEIVITAVGTDADLAVKTLADIIS